MFCQGHSFVVFWMTISSPSKGNSQQSLLHFVIATAKTIFDVHQGRDQPNLAFVTSRLLLFSRGASGHVIKIY